MDNLLGALVPRALMSKCPCMSPAAALGDFWHRAGHSTYWKVDGSTMGGRH